MELRYLPSGAAVATTGFASNRTWKDKATGETKSEVMFIDIVIYGRAAEIAKQYLTKGKKLLIEGRLVFEQWVDQGGQKRSKHLISVETFEFLDNKSKNETEVDEYKNEENNFDEEGEIPL
jgi:single-strand DNA-binding protein